VILAAALAGVILAIAVGLPRTVRMRCSLERVHAVLVIEDD
jgi:uncharacterized integral membrane protein